MATHPGAALALWVPRLSLVLLSACGFEPIDYGAPAPDAAADAGGEGGGVGGDANAFVPLCPGAPVDDFAATLLSEQWLRDIYGAADIRVDNQEAVVTLTAKPGEAYLFSAKAFTFQDCAVLVHLKQFPDVNLAVGAMFRVTSSAKSVGFYVAGGQIYAQEDQNPELEIPHAYSSTDMWLRIRRIQAAVAWDASKDGKHWFEITSREVPIPFDGVLALGAGVYDDLATDPVATRFDDVNRAP